MCRYDLRVGLRLHSQVIPFLCQGLVWSRSQQAAWFPQPGAVHQGLRPGPGAGARGWAGTGPLDAHARSFPA